MIEKATHFESDEHVRWGELKRTILMRLAFKMALLTKGRGGSAGASRSSDENSTNPNMN